VSAQLREWVETGIIHDKERTFTVDRGIGQLIANLASGSSEADYTEILSLERMPGGSHARVDHGLVAAVDISRAKGYRMDLSRARLGRANNEDWEAAKAEAVKGAAVVLTALPGAAFGVGFTRPGEPGANGARDATPSHQAFLDETVNGADGKPVYANECKGGRCTPLSQSLPHMSAETQKVLRPLVDKMAARVRDAYPDGVDHLHVQRPAGVSTR
jgi:hypothetical protein